MSAVQHFLGPEIVLFNIDHEYLETVQLGVTKEFTVGACQVYRPMRGSARVTILKPRPGYRTLVVVDGGSPQVMEDPSDAAEHLTQALCKEMQDFIVAVLLPRSSTHGSYFVDQLRAEDVAVYEIWPPKLRSRGVWRRGGPDTAAIEAVGRRIREIWNKANNLDPPPGGPDDSPDDDADGGAGPSGGDGRTWLRKIRDGFLDVTGAPGDAP